MSLKLGFEGEEGTQLWCLRQNQKSLDSIATSLERIAKCLENKNQ